MQRPALLKKYSNTQALSKLSNKNKLNIDPKIFEDTGNARGTAEIVLSRLMKGV